MGSDVDNGSLSRADASYTLTEKINPHGTDHKLLESESEYSLQGNESPDLVKVGRELTKQAVDSGIKGREIGVLFKDLDVVGLSATARQQDTLGSILNPRDIFKTARDSRHPALRNIIQGFEGVIRPGEMLLVLGQPGAGCSTFLKVLANQRGEYRAIEGEVHYDSFTPEEIQKHYRGDVQYCPEDDVHFSGLTVEQTISFAARMRTPHIRINGESREEHVKRVTDLLLNVFGLTQVRNTLIGNAMIRGVSGGEKKRVSICEALATLSRLNSWDNSTRGLDASTALEFVQALRLATDLSRMTTIVSLYQAGESLYRLFDKVCVIYEGKMAYFGPAAKARQYFIDMGYNPAPRQTTADFLVAMTDPSGRFIRSGIESRVPRTAVEFADHFKQSPLGETNRQDMESYKRDFIGNSQRKDKYKESVQQTYAGHADRNGPIITSLPMQVRALMTRRFQILLGSVIAQVTQVVVFVVQAVLVGTTFLRLPNTTPTFFSRGGVIYFAILFTVVSSMAEIPALYADRPIIIRQHRVAMYHPFVEALSLTLVDIPITAFIIIVFSIVFYFTVNFTQSAAAFFIFMLFIFMITVALKAWFRALAAAFETPAPAQTCAGLSLLVFVLYTGYIITPPTMIAALRWLTHINPLRYGFESLMLNEFHTRRAECTTLVPSGPGYEGVSLTNQVCTAIGAVPGQTFVDGNIYLKLAYDYDYSHMWRNFGIVLAFMTFFVVNYLVFIEWNTRTSFVTSAILYKRGTKAAEVNDQTDTLNADEEKAAGSISPNPIFIPRTKRVAEKAIVMTDTFTWQHLNYTIQLKKEAKQLLNNVSGYVAPGKLTALVGASGAGKTTLLNVLAERTDIGVVTGDRFVNGHPLPADFQAQTGYCQQADTHLATTTVREAVLFSAKLRQPPSIPLAEKEAYVETCLNMCGLENHAEAIVGTLGVEHRKRTTIAVELAAKPRLLLFLDEPTSGLDSQSAWAIVSVLRYLADSGQAILCTIHQPSAELFSVFDNLLLLQTGGQTVYFGELGRNGETLIDYFQRNGARNCAPDENPAEYMLDVIGAGAAAQSDRDWFDTWKKSPEATRLQDELESIHAEGRGRPAVDVTHESEIATSWLYQAKTLTKRDLEAHWRDPTYLMSRIMLMVISGLFVGFTFWKSDNSLQGITNKLFAIYMASVQSISAANQLQVPWIAVRDVYEIRERPSRMYTWSALVTSQILAEIPWNILACTLLFLCSYWTVGFPTDRAGYTFLMLGIIYPLYYMSAGQAVAALSPTAEIANAVFSFLFAFVSLYNGVLQPYNQLGWWQWCYWATPFTYLIGGLLSQAIGGQDITCSPYEFVSVNPPAGQTCAQYMNTYISNAGGYLNNPSATEACQYCSYRTTDSFMEIAFSLKYSNRWRDVGVMVAFTVGNIIAAYLFTYLFRIPKRKRRS